MADTQTITNDSSLSDSLGFDINKLPPAFRQEAAAKERAAESKIDYETSKQKAQAEGKVNALNKFSEESKAYHAEIEKQMLPEPEFKPTQDNAADIGGLFSMIATMGVALGGSGKLSGLNAMNAMGGMLKGYQQGRKDLFTKEQATFDKELASMKAHNDLLIKKLAEYDALRVTDKEAALIKGGEIDALFPGLIAKNRQAAKDDVNANIAQANREMIVKMAEKRASLGLAGNGKGGSRSAINERFENTVLRSGNEIVRSLGLLEQIGIETGGGALGGVVGKGTITSELAANLGRSLTSDEQKAYNAAAGGMALELAYVLNGGYKPNQGQIDELRNLYMATPQDDLGSAAYKFADVAAKLKAALEVAPDYTPEQKLYKQNILTKLSQYAPPEVVYERQYGQPMRQESAVRADGGVTPTPAPTQKPTPARSDIDYYKQNKTPEMKKRFIDRFGVDPDTLG